MYYPYYRPVVIPWVCARITLQISLTATNVAFLTCSMHAGTTNEVKNPILTLDYRKTSIHLIQKNPILTLDYRKSAIHPIHKIDIYIYQYTHV